MWDLASVNLLLNWSLGLYFRETFDEALSPSSSSVLVQGLQGAKALLASIESYWRYVSATLELVSNSYLFEILWE